MGRIYAIVGVLISGAYFAAVSYLLGSRFSELGGMKLNEIGDFSAGILGPLALFWLILGYLQQGLELKLNTRALELQVEELRASVSQQRELVAVSRQQFETELEVLKYERRRLEDSARPRFVFHGVGGIHRGDWQTTFCTKIKNVGATATSVTISSDPSMQKISRTIVHSWVNNQDVDLEFEYEGWVPVDGVKFVVRYTDSSGVFGGSSYSSVRP